MKVIEILEREHGVIRKMLRKIDDELEMIAEQNRLDIEFIDAAIDFFKVYANEFHHGKEEKFLFRGIEGRNPAQEHLSYVQTLYDEHREGERLVTELGAAMDKWKFRDEGSIVDIVRIIKTAGDFYKKHLRNEEKDYFPVFMDYYSAEEDSRLAASCENFDRDFINRKYTRYF